MISQGLNERGGVVTFGLNRWRVVSIVLILTPGHSLAVLPERRLEFVDPEHREFGVESEERAMDVDPEPRGLTVGEDARDLEIDDESRALSTESEDRVYAVGDKMKTWSKDPTARLDWTIDWAARGWLQAGETIIDADWEVLSGDVEIGAGDFAPTRTTTTTTVWLEGGTFNSEADVACTITTSSSPARTDRRILSLRILLRYS